MFVSAVSLARSTYENSNSSVTNGPGTVLKDYLMQSSSHLRKAGAVIIFPILQKRKLRHRQVK